MNSKLPMTSSRNFDVATASQDVAFEHAGSVTELMGRVTKPIGPTLETLELEEETLVIDDRFGLSPSQLVESKLTRKLQETSLPVSHLQTRTLIRRR